MKCYSKRKKSKKSFGVIMKLSTFVAKRNVKYFRNESAKLIIAYNLC